MQAVDFLNLLTTEGLKSISFDAIRSVRLLDERLDSEMRKALEILSLGRDEKKKRCRWTSSARGRARSGWATSRRPRCGRRATAWSRPREQALPAGLGDRREHDRDGLGGRGVLAGLRPAHLLHHEPLRAALRPAPGRRAPDAGGRAAPDLRAGAGGAQGGDRPIGAGAMERARRSDRGGARPAPAPAAMSRPGAPPPRRAGSTSSAASRPPPPPSRWARASSTG